MVLFNGFRKYLVVFFLVMLSASSSLAAANNLSFESDTDYQMMQPTNEPPIIKSAEINSACFSVYVTDFKSAVSALERGDTAGSMNECFGDTATISLHKDDGKIIWSVAPSLSRLSFNPLDNIRNLQVVLKYRF